MYYDEIQIISFKNLGNWVIFESEVIHEDFIGVASLQNWSLLLFLLQLKLLIVFWLGVRLRV
jgi:hypothetical protein